MSVLAAVGDASAGSLQGVTGAVAYVLACPVSASLKWELTCVQRAGNVASVDGLDTMTSASTAGYTADAIGRPRVAGLTRRERVVAALGVQATQVGDEGAGWT